MGLFPSLRLYHDAPPDTTPSCPANVMIALPLLRSLHYKGQLSIVEASFIVEHYKNPIVLEHMGGGHCKFSDRFSFSFSKGL